MTDILPNRISGIYPRLAVTNQGHTECGIGAVICQGERLYFITYAASGAHGDDNKLYAVDGNMQLSAYPGSVGGTHANRYYHAPSGQWIIGAYFLGKNGEIRALDPQGFIGRLTGAGRHISDPDHFVYINTMEDGLYEVNVETLAYRRLRRDRFDDLARPEMRLAAAPLKLWGDHGKGGYGGQGVFVLSNNGHGGVLAEWDGRGDAQRRESWRIVDRAKYTEITSPRDAKGPADPGAPIWAVGWDHKSVLLNVRTPDGAWTRYRLPKASYTQDADHGWYTEWPRIRAVHGKQLLCMHGMFYEMPENFTPTQTAGIRPLARHLKMIADWTEWKDEIAFACDDASVFGNPILGRQQSNLWFSSLEQLAGQSAPEAFGCLCQSENMDVGVATEPFFVGGFDHKILQITHEEQANVRYIIEEDLDGGGVWTYAGELALPPYQENDPAAGCAFMDLKGVVRGDWIRILADCDATCVTASLYMTSEKRTERDAELVRGLHDIQSPAAWNQGLLRPLPDEALRLSYETDQGYFILDERLAPAEGKMDPIAQLKTDVQVLPGSVLIIDARGRRWRLPKLSDAYDGLTDRQLREVVTERTLLNVCGSIFEVPREPAGEFMRMKPVTTHGKRIHDFCSYRGMLVLSGVDDGADSPHIIRTQGAALWLGNVDDLWKFGKPVGEARLCEGETLLPGEASDPLLMAGYDRKRVELTADRDAQISLETDAAATGAWGRHQRFSLRAGEKLTYEFPEGYCAHWVRLRALTACGLTARFIYS